jgi:microcystin-dependent protein
MTLTEFKVGDVICRPIGWRSPGWIPCDARELRRTEYPHLFAVLGTTYGSAGPNWFRIPLLAEADRQYVEYYIYAGSD